MGKPLSTLVLYLTRGIPVEKNGIREDRNLVKEMNASDRGAECVRRSESAFQTQIMDKRKPVDSPGDSVAGDTTGRSHRCDISSAGIESTSNSCRKRIRGVENEPQNSDFDNCGAPQPSCSVTHSVTVELPCLNKDVLDCTASSSTDCEAGCIRKKYVKLCSEKQRSLPDLFSLNEGDNTNGSQPIKQTNSLSNGLQTSPSPELHLGAVSPGGTDIELSKAVTRSEDSVCSLGPIRGLPPHLLLRVFHYLPLADLLHRAGLVCKNWFVLSRDSDLWRTIDLHGQFKVDDDVLDRMMSYSDNVMKLDITDSRLVTSDGLTKALKNCPNIQHLYLVRCHHLTERAFMSVGTSCKHVVSLKLECCYAVSDNALTAIGGGCHNLRDIRLNQCCMVTSQGVSALAQGCRELRSISIDQCTKVDSTCLAELAAHCPHLQAFSAMNCNFTNDTIVQLAQLRELHTLELPSISALTTGGVGNLLRRCHKLTTLNLSLCWNIDDSCVELIGRYLPGLHNLYLISCNLTDKALDILSQHCKHLQTLDVGWCKHITDAGVRQIAENSPNLTYLGLMRCDQVTMAFSEEMVQKFPKIAFSTMWLDCRRLLERAQQEGIAVGTLPLSGHS